jgi:hypothetical protein
MFLIRLCVETTCYAVHLRAAVLFAAIQAIWPASYSVPMNNSFSTRRPYRGTRGRHYSPEVGSYRPTPHLSTNLFTSCRHCFFGLVLSADVNLALRLWEYGIIAWCLDAVCVVLEAIGKWLLVRFCLRRRGKLTLTILSHWATTSPSTRLSLPSAAPACVLIRYAITLLQQLLLAADQRCGAG